MVEIYTIQTQNLALGTDFIVFMTGTLNAFATVSIGKEKFETCVIDKGTEPFSWENEAILL